MLQGNSKTGKSLYKGPMGSYVIKNVVKEQEGEYTCVVENKYGAQEGTVDLRVTGLYCIRIVYVLYFFVLVIKNNIY